MSGRLGVTFRETMAGGFSLGATDPREGERAGREAGAVLAMHAEVRIADLALFIADPQHRGELSGSIDYGPFGGDVRAKAGVFNLFSPSDRPGLRLMVYEMAFVWNGEDHYLAGRKEVRDDPGFDLWSDTTTLYATLHRGPDPSGPVIGAGVLTLGPLDLLQLMRGLRVTGASSPLEYGEALARFGSFFLGRLWDAYAPLATEPRTWWRRLFRWGS